MALGWEDKGGRGKDGCALLGRGIRIHFCSHLSVFNQKLHVELLSRIFLGHQKFYWSNFSKALTILHVLYFHSLLNQPSIHFYVSVGFEGQSTEAALPLLIPHPPGSNLYTSENLEIFELQGTNVLQGGPSCSEL